MNVFPNAIILHVEDFEAAYQGLGQPDTTGKVYGIVIQCDGDPDELYQKVYPDNGKDFQLKELYSYVGSPIELVKFDEKFMIINEEGKLKELELNMEATILANTLPYDVIVGNALICRKIIL